MIDAEKSDLYDVLAYIAFALAPITRQERVDASREQIFSRYDRQASGVPGFCPLAICQGRRRASWIKPNYRICWS